MRWSRWTVLGLALGVALLLGACGTLPSTLVAQVPTSGPIEQGAVVPAGEQSQVIRVIARGPQPDMTPQQIVRGFLDASASFDGDHAVAREYLTPAASSRWNPAAGVAVYEGAGDVRRRGDRVLFEARQVGAISAAGSYAAAAAGSRLSAEFELLSVAGQWRISTPPNGLVLSNIDVDRGFRVQSVYFFNPEFTTLVPDPRMVPVLGASQATSLIRYLLDGPTSWLAPAVRTGFTQGITLNVDAVPVADGVATVDLNAVARSASDATRQAISEQIVWTLKQVPGVERVLLTAVGQPLQVAGVSSPQPVTSWPTVDPAGLASTARGYAVLPDGVHVIDGIGASRPVAGAAGAGPLPVTEIAVAADSVGLAGIAEGGELWLGSMRDGGGFAPIRFPARAESIAFDPQGRLWVVDDAGRVTAVQGDRAQRVAVDGLDAGTTIRQAVPSRDGTRVALVVADGGVDRLLLARIVRSMDDDEVAVQAPRRVESLLGDVLDVSWSAADALVVIGRLDDLLTGIFEVDIGRASVTDLGALEGSASVAAAPGRATMVQSLDSVYRRQADLWEEVVVGRSPAYPG